MRSVSTTTNGAGAFPGCTNNPGAALQAAVISAGDRARHDQRRIGGAIGDNAVDVGLGLAEQTNRVAPRAEVAFRRLMIGRRLIDVALRHGQRLVQFA